MKKIFTLLWLTLAAFMFKATAQTTPNCNAEFSVQYLTNYTVKFNPVLVTDSPYVHHSWNFGDATATSQLISPTHTYALPGTYNVVHTVVRYNPNNVPICTQSFTKQVVITEPCNLVVDYSWNATATNPLQIEFHNLSVPLAASDSVTWIFGDNSPNAYTTNATHTYANAGTYNVCLIVKKNANTTPAPCVKYICKTITVSAPCTLVADFNWTVTQTNPLRIEFHNLSTPLAASDSITWTFGDGTSSADVNPVHIYNVAGTYVVCLRIKKLTPAGTTPCIREICKTIVVTQPCNLVVDFNWTVTQANPLRIEFHNLSTPLAASDSITWTFGDGSSSTDVNPVHTYANAGTYIVCLTVKKVTAAGAPICVGEICKTIVVTSPCNMVPDFTWTATQTNPLVIEFHNTSTNTIATDSTRWSFGDGTFSSLLNPVHTYIAAGTYTVCLRIIRYNAANTTPCIKEICKTVVVFAPCTLVVNFTSQPDPGNPLRVKFTNTSTPINTTDSVRWTFGDGTSVSGLQSDPNVANPTHNYANAGNYTVCLLVKKNANSQTPVNCVREKCTTVAVTAPCNFVVNFSWRLDSINVKKVYFTNLTTAPSANAIAVWNFGDGTSATSWNAIHEYTLPGQYRVCLRVYSGSNTTCFRELCDTVVVPVPAPACIDLSKYHFENVPGDNQKYKFTPDYVNTTFQYTWTFGDGTGSHDPIAIHRYAQPGVYVTCLTVWRSNTCASTTCKEIRVAAQINCDSAHTGYTYARYPNVPNKIQFYANATLPILDQTWYIYKMNGTVASTPVILHQNNPIYLFQDTGNYKVCLRAVLTGGCVKEYCSNIYIGQVSNACELQAFPNPAGSTVNVNVYLTQPEMIHAYLYNSLNVLVLQKDQQGTTGNNLVTLNLGSLAAGQYTIKLIYGNSICYARFQKL